MMTDTDTDIEMTREAIGDGEMHASPSLNSLKEITALWHLAVEFYVFIFQTKDVKR
jgi:hypothetical protein